MSSQPVLPSIYLKDIENFISLVGQTVIQQTVVPNSSKLYPIAEYSINALVYNDTELEYESPAENVYSVESCQSEDGKQFQLYDQSGLCYESVAFTCWNLSYI